ncbi:MAG: glucose-6-phosphate dehydrogenase, partial [Acidimicrobiales bacterium]
PTLFIRSDEVEQSWKVVAPVLSAWEAGDVPVSRYEAGSWGPRQADRLIEAGGRRWRRP